MIILIYKIKERRKNTISMTLREAREYRKMTREELAYRLGVSYPTVQNWEYGRTVPSLPKQREIESLLMMKGEILFTHNDN